MIENRETQLRQIARWFDLGTDHTIEQFTTHFLENSPEFDPETTLSGTAPENLGGIAYFAIHLGASGGNLALPPS